VNTNLILFDIDKTLFDTSRFIAGAEQRLQELTHLSAEDIALLKTSYGQTLDKYTDFDPWKFCTYVAESLNKDPQQLIKAYIDTNLFPTLLYEDVKPELTKLATTHTLGVFSEGVEKWQELKLSAGKIIDLFDPNHIYISRRKTASEYLSSLPEAVVLDDNNQVISELVKYPQFTIIQMDRSHRADLIGTTIITSLKELQNYV